MIIKPQTPSSPSYGISESSLSSTSDSDSSSASTPSSTGTTDNPIPDIGNDDVNLRRRVARIRYDPATGELAPYPPLNTSRDLDAFIQRLEQDLKDRGIPQDSWSDAAILFLEGQVNMIMRKIRQARRDLGAMSWVWADFVGSLRDVMAELDAPGPLQIFKEEHPKLATAATVAGTGLVVGGGIALAPLVVVGGLNALGFTATGVAGGSVAAGLQSALYGGATTGLFSACQSIAATAAVPAITSVVSAAGSLIAGVTILGSRHTSNASDTEDPHSPAPPTDPGESREGTDQTPPPPPPPYHV